MTAQSVVHVSWHSKAPTGPLMILLGPARADFTACAFSPDGESLVTVANDEAATLTCWNLPKSKVGSGLT